MDRTPPNNIKNYFNKSNCREREREKQKCLRDVLPVRFSLGLLNAFTCVMFCEQPSWCEMQSMASFRRRFYRSSSWMTSPWRRHQDIWVVRILNNENKNQKQFNNSFILNKKTIEIYIPIPQLTMPAWIHGEPGEDWTSSGPPLSPCHI